MKKNYMFLLLVIAALLSVAIIVVFSGSKFPLRVQRFISLDCDSCTDDLTSFDDCRAYLERRRFDNDVVSVADKFGVNLENVTKIIKKATLPDGKITCTYYG
ncbi:MAG: hypothetical protein HYX24_02455 [Candidatus Aenigmarchaeota archaeon]|nr:hypothetical protein [Candidatus Aenigmarchaeota archaeon]